MTCCTRNPANSGQGGAKAWVAAGAHRPQATGTPRTLQPSVQRGPPKSVQRRPTQATLRACHDPLTLSVRSTTVTLAGDSGDGQVKLLDAGTPPTENDTVPFETLVLHAAAREAAAPALSHATLLQTIAMGSVHVAAVSGEAGRRCWLKDATNTGVVSKQQCSKGVPGWPVVAGDP